MSLNTHSREACNLTLRGIAETPDGRDIDITFYFDTDFTEVDTTLTGICHIPDCKACTQRSQNGLGRIGGGILTKQVRGFVDHHRLQITNEGEVAELSLGHRSCLERYLATFRIGLALCGKLVKSKAINGPQGGRCSAGLSL